MARVNLVDETTIKDEMIQGILNQVAQLEGKVPNHFRAELNFPALFKAMLETTRVLWMEGELPMKTIQYIAAAVSKANGCQYCAAAHCTILNRGLGEKEDDLLGFLKDYKKSAIGDRDKVIVEFALKVNHDPHSVTDSDMQELRGAGISDKGIVQIIHAVNNFSAYNRFNIVLKTDYDYADLWRKAL